MDRQTKAKAEQYTDIMLEHMPVGVALYDVHDFRLLMANPLYHKFLDSNLAPAWKGGRAIGHPLMDWVPGEVASYFISIFRRVAETGEQYRAGEYVLQGHACGITYWNWTLDPIRNSEGHINLLLLIANEVTTQVLARQEAEEAHASLSQVNRTVEVERKRLEVIETVARNVRESIEIETVGKAAIDAINFHFNSIDVYIHIADPVQQALRLFHIHDTPHDKQTLTVLEYIPYSSSLMLLARAHNRRDPIVIEDLASAVASGLIDSKHPLVTPDKHGFICVSLWFKDYFEGTLVATFQNVIHADSPEVETLIGCGTHIAAALAHARLHATIENERARLHAVLDQLPEGIVIVDSSNGCISYANATAADMLGTPLSSLVGKPPRRYPSTHVVKDTYNRLILPWNFVVIRTLAGEKISSQETMVIRPDGSNMFTLSSATPIRLENGVITGAAIVFQDITAQKSIEQQKNEFLSIASHELRTPITAIMGYAEILEMKASQDSSLDPICLHAIASIIEQSEGLTRLIEEMLDISRIEHAQLDLLPSVHDLLKTLHHVVESQATTTRKHHLHLILEGLELTDTLMGYYDEARITQVLSNLINNAIKYSPSGGEIEVGLRYTPGAPADALIWVKDQGIGIPARELPHIFNRFHRASGPNSSINGLGIGLYLVNELVNSHGGHVWVESAEGAGSTFFVTLPLHANQQ
ncbi:MAG TPA: ATP-binding protein [Ktedonobacteraceae bacterium]